MRLLILLSMVFLTACNTIDATVSGTEGVVRGAAQDTLGITSGTLDVVSGTIKEVADRTVSEDEES